MSKEKILAWIKLSRPPFHTVGLFPFVLGAVIAAKIEGTFNWAILGWGSLAVVLIMLTTYYTGEYFDYETDEISAKLERNIFSAGTQVLQNTKVIPRHYALIAAYFSLFLALGLGFLLQFGYKTGEITLPLGLLGIFAGFFIPINQSSGLIEV